MQLVDNKIALSCENIVFHNDKLWFTEMNCNEFYCYDILVGNMQLIYKIETESEYKNRLFGAVIPYENFMYLIPFSAEKIYKIDIDKGTVESIMLIMPPHIFKHDYLENAKFMSAHKYQECIYLMPTSYPAIVEINCKTGDVMYYDDWIFLVKDKCGISGSVFFRKTLLKDNIIYAPFCDANAVLKFDLITKRIKIITVGSDRCGYSAICYDGDSFWLSPRKRGPVVRWNEENNQCMEYDIIPSEYKRHEGGFADIVYAQNKILLFPLFDEAPLKIDLITNNIEKIELNDCETGHMCQCTDGKKIYFFSAINGYLFVMDPQNEKIEEKQIFFPEKQKKYHIKFFSYSYQFFKVLKIVQNRLFYEEYPNAIEDYMSYITDLNYKEEEKKNINAYGTNIWKTLII